MPKPTRLHTGHFDRKLATLISALLLLMAPVPALAVDLIPLLGYTGGGQFEDSDSGDQWSVDGSNSLALILAFDSERDKQYELLYSRQSSSLSSDDGLTSTPLLDIDFHYLHFGGNYFFNGSSDLSPYVAGGIGLTWIDPKVENGNDQVKPSMNLALGLNWMLTENLGLRTEMRGYGSLMSNTTVISCDGACNIKVAGQLLLQYQLNAGILFRF
ncbi:MAG: hypothetical protein V7707_18410 [Motiliproteus sp.]